MSGTSPKLRAIALTSSSHHGESYDLVGPDLYTGVSTAAAWSRALGRKVTYAGDDLDAWERQSLTYMPAWMAFDFRLMYRNLPEARIEGVT